MEEKQYLVYCKELKLNMLTMLQSGKSGHIGGSLSCIEALAVIFQEFLLNTNNKLIYSKGHCELALYAILFQEKILDPCHMRQFKSFRSPLQGHPSRKWIQKVEYSGGSLGQGLSFGVGMAICGKADGYQVYVMLGDGELQEGQIWEAAITALSLSLDNLYVIVDCNGLQLEGDTILTGDVHRMHRMWSELGWDASVVEDGHSVGALLNQFQMPNKNEKPHIYFIKTVKGHGVPFMENNSDYHGVNLTAEEFEVAMNILMRDTE